MEKVALAQSCFWTGEMKLGALPGVVQTEAGYFDGHEVTLVEFDPRRTTLKALLAEAKTARVAEAVYLTKDDQAATARQAGYPDAGKLNNGYTPAPASDQKKQLQGTAFARLTLTPEQATKVNAFARTFPDEALKFLTAAQRTALGR